MHEKSRITPLTHLSYSARGAFLFVCLITTWRLLFLIRTPFNLSFDEAQYWIWAQSPAWGYFSKPPMIGWVISASTSICGDSELCVRSGTLLSYTITSLALYTVGRHLYTAEVGFWSTAMFITLPGVTFSSALITVDPLLLMFWSISLMVLTYALAVNRFTLWLALGVTIGAGTLAKYAMLFFPASLFLYLFWSPNHYYLLQQRGPWIATSLGLVFLLPNLIWNAANGFVTLAHTWENIYLVPDHLFQPKNGVSFLTSLFAVFGPIPMGTLLIFLFRGSSEIVYDDKNRFLLAFSVPILVMMLIEAFLSRAHANWSAPAFESATVLIVSWLVNQNRNWLLKVTVALHITAAAILYSMVLAPPSSACYQFIARRTPFKHVYGWDSIGRQILSVRTHYPNTALLFDTRKVLAPIVYYMRPFGFDAAVWNNADMPSNHFEFITDLSRAIGLNFLLVTEQHTADHVSQTFDRIEPVAVLRVMSYMNLTREIYIFYCSGFRGY